MKITAYSCRPDELAMFEKFRKETGVQLCRVPDGPYGQHASMA